MSMEELNAELEALKRGPASVQKIDEAKRPVNVDGTVPADTRYSYNKEKTLFDIPTRAAIPQSEGLLPTGGAETVVGGRDPDYSGYDDLKNKIKKPEGASWVDWAAMLGTAGLGAAFGRADVGFTQAGKYGQERAKDIQKRDAEFEKQLLAIDMARATQMAKGAKGTKVKASAGGIDAKTLSRLTYVGKDGLQRRYTRLGEDGMPIETDNDPLASLDTQALDFQKHDGGKEQGIRVGNKFQPASYLSPKLDITETPDGVKAGVNKHDIQSGIKPIAGMDKTSAGYSPRVTAMLGNVKRDYLKDGTVQKAEVAYKDIETALSALRDGSPQQLLLIKRYLGMAMDKGRSLTNDEFAQVSKLDLGILNRIDAAITSGKSGEATNLIRQSYERMATNVERANRELWNARTQKYNDLIREQAKGEFHPSMLLKPQSAYTADKQSKAYKQIEQKTKELSSGTTTIRNVKAKDGSTQTLEYVYDGAKFNPKTGKKGMWVINKRLK